MAYMSGKCIFISGGARSGKSRFAQELASGMNRKVLFVATAEPLDIDMKARIEKHQADRPDSWITLEASTNVAAKIAEHIGDAEIVLLDCLTLLVSNVILGEDRGFSSEEINADEAEDRVVEEIQSIIDFMQKSQATFIIVSNEVGLGVVPENRFARIYRDLLGKANQLVARYADEVYFMVSGIPIKVKP
jgi:adenosylcobinamide kinase/adenosylcobinamide-phosphate guanylyltransferase